MGVFICTYVCNHNNPLFLTDISCLKKQVAANVKCKNAPSIQTVACLKGYWFSFYNCHRQIVLFPIYWDHLSDMYKHYGCHWTSQYQVGEVCIYHDAHIVIICNTISGFDQHLDMMEKCFWVKRFCLNIKQRVPTNDPVKEKNGYILGRHFDW